MSNIFYILFRKSDGGRNGGERKQEEGDEEGGGGGRRKREKEVDRDDFMSVDRAVPVTFSSGKC